MISNKNFMSYLLPFWLILLILSWIVIYSEQEEINFNKSCKEKGGTYVYSQRSDTLCIKWEILNYLPENESFLGWFVWRITNLK